MKRDNAVIANFSASAGAEEAGTSSLVQIPVLKVDRKRRKLVSCKSRFGLSAPLTCAPSEICTLQ